jgi:hypothetical protein
VAPRARTSGLFFPLGHEQAESFLSCAREGFSTGNYGVMPFSWQPDFNIHHASVALALAMALTAPARLFGYWGSNGAE